MTFFFRFTSLFVAFCPNVEKIYSNLELSFTVTKKKKKKKKKWLKSRIHECGEGNPYFLDFSDAGIIGERKKFGSKPPYLLNAVRVV